MQSSHQNDGSSHGVVFASKPEFDEKLIAAVRALLASGSTKRLQSKIRTLHVADLADLLEMLSLHELSLYNKAISWLPDCAVLIKLSVGRRSQLLNYFSTSKLAASFNDYELSDLVDVLDGIAATTQRAILSKFSISKRTNIRSRLAADPYSAKRIMRDDYLLASQDMSVSEALQWVRDNADKLPKRFYDVYVTSGDNKIAGLVTVSSLLLQPENTALKDVMVQKVHTVTENTDQEDIAKLFSRYGLTSLPVVNKEKEQLGIILIDDILEVIEEEAEQDIFALGGVQSEPEPTASIWRGSLSRFPWLSINMATGLLSSAVVMVFKASIESMVLLAVMIPIITSVGGNAATQSMTVAVRHLVTNELNQLNVVSSVFREIRMGLLNAVFLSFIMVGITVVWFNDLQLGLVCSLSIIINVAAASFAGVVIPFSLDKRGFDPAVSSPVFVTMVTDVVGFISLLGLATLLIL